MKKERRCQGRRQQVRDAGSSERRRLEIHTLVVATVAAVPHPDTELSPRPVVGLGRIDAARVGVGIDGRWQRYLPQRAAGRVGDQRPVDVGVDGPAVEDVRHAVPVLGLERSRVAGRRHAVPIN